MSVSNNCPVLWCEYSSSPNFLGYCSSHFKSHGDPSAVIQKILDGGCKEAPSLESLQRRKRLHKAWDDIKTSLDSLSNNNESDIESEIKSLSETIQSHMEEVARVNDKIEFDPVLFLKAVDRCVKNENTNGIQALSMAYPDSFPCDLDQDNDCLLDHYSESKNPPRAICPMGLAFHYFVDTKGKLHSDKMKKFFLESPLISGDTVPPATLCSLVYVDSSDNDFILDACRKCTVTKKVVDAAKYLNKNPPNISTPERREMLRGVEAIFKEQQKAKREQRKRELAAEKEAELAVESTKEAPPEEEEGNGARSSRRRTRRGAPEPVDIEPPSTRQRRTRGRK